MAASTRGPAFVMHGARAAVAGGISHIEEQVKALERAIAENTGLAFDLARTLIESTCRRIITERGGSFDKKDDLSKLFRTASQILPFLPPALSTYAEARKSLAQVLNGLNTALQGVCELRNTFGFASHGSDYPRPAMEEVQALLAAQAADAIVGFLYRAHVQDMARPHSAPLSFADHPDFNDWIDEQSDPVQILSLPAYRPSEVLFNVDPEAYNVALTEYAENVDTEQEEEEEGGAAP